MLYLDRIPAPPIGDFVERIWYCERPGTEFALERELPHGQAQLIVNLTEDESRLYAPDAADQPASRLSGNLLCGVQSRYWIIDTIEQQCATGVCFKPGGTLGFFRLPANEISDTFLSLHEVAGRAFSARLRDRLLSAPTPEAKLTVWEDMLQELWIDAQIDPVIPFALSRLANGTVPQHLADIAATCGLSQKRFIERFKSAVGLTPKHYARLLRFQRALAQASRNCKLDWTSIAHECGYFDQAHFIHDFRSFAAITPSEYKACATEFQNHVKFLQSKTS